MEADAPGDITLLLRAAQQGDRAAFDAVYQMAYEELRHLAHAVKPRGRHETLNTTALVHELYLKLSPAPRGGPVRDRAHFYSIAARAMRQVLVDAARRRSAEKRGGGEFIVSLDEENDLVPALSAADADRHEQVIALDDALRKLQAWSARQASVVECRVFAGLSVEETAQALDVSEATVKRDWQTARAWLALKLEGGGG